MKITVNAMHSGRSVSFKIWNVFSNELHNWY